MKLVAIETSTERLSLAAAAHGRLRESTFVVGQRHAELALDALDALLAQTGLDRRDIEGVAFGAGPGSFTGVRIAAGIAQGLALGLGIPVLGVSTLEALAEPADAARVIACLDARMGEVYFAAYERVGDAWSVVAPPMVCAPEEIPLPGGEGWTGRGSGFAAHGERLRRRLGAALGSVDAGAFPTAGAVLRLAAPRFAAGAGVDPADAQPVYLREKVALKTSERT